MTNVSNPALATFVTHWRDEVTLAQVLIRRAAAGYELRHVADREAAPDSLSLLKCSELRALAQTTAEGAFRPLKSAPNLRAGWRSLPATDAELEAALQQLYPGALADWFAAQSSPSPVTDYRAFTGRQTGMYRITAMLDDAQATFAIGACCDRRFCLKQRCWTVAGLEPDGVTEKSLIPCLEPCAVLLEFARKAMRLLQEDKVRVELAPDELATLRAALEAAAIHPVTGREADFGNPLNPRRLELLRRKLEPLLRAPAPNPSAAEK